MDRPDGDTLHKILDRIDSKRDDLTTILCASTQTMQEKVDVMWKDVAAALTR
jgi:hypothetical protein